MNFKNIIVANMVYRAFAHDYLAENHAIADNLTGEDEKEVLLPLYAESLDAVESLTGEMIPCAPLSSDLTGSGLRNDVSALLKVMERTVEAFLQDYHYSASKLFAKLTAKPVIVYQLAFLLTEGFYTNYRVDPVQFGCVIVDLRQEQAKKEEQEQEEARVRSIVADWEKLEGAYVEALDTYGKRAYYADKADGFLPESLREAYETAKPYLKR